MKRQNRTDLALEEFEFVKDSAAEELDKLEGVEAAEYTLRGFRVTEIEISGDEISRKLCKPKGQYITIELDELLSRRQNAFKDAAELLAELLRPLLSLDMPGSTLIAGLGNMAITPDAVGPLTVESIMATRHLKQHLPAEFAGFRSVAAIAPGVLGSTGIESVEVLRSVSAGVSPVRIIAVDALASSNLARLCRTVQISDAGIVPGSGVGNNRAGLSRETLGVPVVAIGVPTVADAYAICKDKEARGMFVTPKDIDSTVRDTAKLIAYGINLAMHDGLTANDIDMFLS